MKRTAILVAVAVLLFTACSIPEKDANTIVNKVIDRTLAQSYNFDGSFIVETDEKGGQIEHTVFDGLYTKDGEYIMHVDIQGLNFSSELDLLQRKKQLYVRNGNVWQKTTEQDLSMFGLDERYNPIAFTSKIKNMAYSIQTTDTKDIYKLTLDKEIFEEEWGLHTLAQENVVQVKEAPVLFVNVKGKVIESIVFRFDVKTDVGNRSVTYQVNLSDYNHNQAIPETLEW